MWKSAIFLAILGLLTTSLKPVFPKSRYHNYQETTVYVSETTRKEIEEELYAFFNTSSSDDALSISEQKASLSVREDLSARINSLSRMETAIGCVFKDVSVVPYLESARLVNENTVDVEVYTITSITYYYPGIDHSDDHMLIGVHHELEIKHYSTGWMILKDSFDERDVTGVASQDILSEEESKTDSPVLDEYTSLQSPLRSYSSYNATAAISNAITNCGFTTSTRRYYARNGIAPYENTSQKNFPHGSFGYDPNYIFFPSADCANFVSQCLYAGGIPKDYDGPPEEKWYYDSSSSYTTSWVGANELKNYLVLSGYGSLSTSSTVYPGNPVFWGSGGHASHTGICVGYNTGNQPVICAHTTDVYRVPLSVLTTLTPQNYIGTIQLATSNQHSVHTPISSTWYYDDDQHYHVCQYCEYPCGCGSHSFNYMGTCNVCGCMEP